MKKNQLLNMKELDVGVLFDHTTPINQYGKQLVADTEDGILKVSVYSTEHIRFGGWKPIYNIFIDQKTENFIVYNFLDERWSHAKLDNLNWPDYTKGSTYTDEKSRECILQYLKSNVNDPYDAILMFQERLREKLLYEKDSKIMKPWQELMKKVPGLPKDWPRWVNQVGITQNFIFYEYKRGGNSQGYCSWCGKMVPIRGAKHNKFGRCKCCRHKIQYKCEGRLPEFFITKDTAYLIQRKIEEGFVVREFYVRRCFSKKDYKRPLIECYERRRVIYNKKMEATEYYYGTYKGRIKGWIEGALKIYRPLQYAEYVPYYRGKVYGKTIPSLSKSELKYTGFAEMLKALNFINPIEYFSLWKSNPYVEQLVKAGLPKIVEEFMNGDRITIKEGRDMGKCLGIDRFRVNRLRDNKGNMLYLKWLQYEKTQNKVIPDSIIQWYTKHFISPEDASFIFDRMSPVQIKNYLLRQSGESKESMNDLLYIWKDYLAMAQRIHMNVCDPIVYRARSLVKRHNEIIDQIEDKKLVLKAAGIAESYPHLDKICGSIVNKYGFEDLEYKIVVPRQIEDILNDAKELHHCVDKGETYFERMNARETYILFLRKKPEIEKPFYTLEIEPDGTIRQARTDFNRQKDDLELARPFLNKWQRQLKNKLDKEDFVLAADSRKAREKELIKLREKKVKINGGDYQGRLLADVLEEGLIENQEILENAA